MLSFELSAIDIVLVIAVLILFFLYASKKPSTAETKSPPQASGKQQKLLEKQIITSRTPKPKTNVTEPKTDSQSCAHFFGYLRNLPSNTPVPGECMGCQKIMRCLFKSE